MARLAGDDSPGPLQISPLPPGELRWTDPFTTTFFPGGDTLPAATTFEVRVPAGTRSLDGGSLARDHVFRFTTAADSPNVVDRHPGYYSVDIPPDTPLALQFDREVDPAEVLPRLRMSDGRGWIPLRLLPPTQWGGPGIPEEVRTWKPERTVVLRPARPLELGKTHRLWLLDRPARVSVKDLSGVANKLELEFDTTPRFELVEARFDPDQGDESPWPSKTLVLGFSYHLRIPPQDLAGLVTVQPPVKDLRLIPSCLNVLVQGQFCPGQRYTVSVAPGLTDSRSRPLGRTLRRTVRAPLAGPVLELPRGAAVMSVPRHQRGGAVPLYSAWLGRARLDVGKLTPELWAELSRALLDDSAPPNGRLVDRLRGRTVTDARPLVLPARAEAVTWLPPRDLPGGDGGSVSLLELTSSELRRYRRDAAPVRRRVVSVTDIGLHVAGDRLRITVLASSLGGGGPLPGVKLALHDSDGKLRWSGETDRHGLAEVRGEADVSWFFHEGCALWATQGKDHALFRLDLQRQRYHPDLPSERVFLATDRGVYRPGETVKVWGVVRGWHPSQWAGKAPAGKGEEIELSVQGRSSGPLAITGKPSLSAARTFSWSFEVPADAAPDTFTISGGRGGRVQFEVVSFRKPDFKVSVQLHGPLAAGEELRARVGGHYLFGGALAGAEVNWKLYRRRVSTLDGHAGYTFGPLPQKRRGDPRIVILDPEYHRDSVAVGRGTLDASGHLEVKRRIAPPDDDGEAPYRYDLEATIYGPGGRSADATGSVVALPAAATVGLLVKDPWWVEAGKPLELHVALARATSAVQNRTPAPEAALPVQVSAYRLPSGSAASMSQPVEAASCTARPAAKPSPCPLVLPGAGAYLLRARTRDAAGRFSTSEVRLWAAGSSGEADRPEKLVLVPRQKRLAAGDRARVLVRSPFRRSRGVLTVMTATGIASVRPLALDNPGTVVEVPLAEEHIPEAILRVVLVEQDAGIRNSHGGSKELPRVAGSVSATVRLEVDTAPKAITLEVTASPAEVRPGKEVEVSLRARDRQGAPVRAELALVVVDEAVLGPLGFKTPDPLKYFWGRDAEPALWTFDSRADLMDARRWSSSAAWLPDLLQADRCRHDPSGGGHSRLMVRRSGGKKVYRITGSFCIGGRATIGPSFYVRSNFASTAHFDPAVQTDARGRARVRFKVPDSLTTYRVMALAVDRDRPDRFGSAEASFRVTQPLLVRPALPRFLTLGDDFEAGVVLHNRTDTGRRVVVQARARGLALEGPGRQEVTLPARSSRTLRYRTKPAAAGEVQVQFAAVSWAAEKTAQKQQTDAVVASLPVRPAGIPRRAVVQGSVTGRVAIPVTLPAPPTGGGKEQGEVSASLSASELTGLVDAVSHLVDYPHGCTEQISSRMLPLLSLHDLLRSFRIRGVAGEKQRREMVREGIGQLAKHQAWASGGFGMWEDSPVAGPGMTAHALTALLLARDHGFTVSQDILDRGLSYLRDAASDLATRLARQVKRRQRRRREYRASEVSVTEQANLARAVLVLARWDRPPRKVLGVLYGVRTRLPLFARFWLLEALHRAADRRARRLLDELSREAERAGQLVRFRETADRDTLASLMHSDDLTLAVALAALLEVAPDSDLVPGLTRALVAARRRGRWQTTQSSAQALLALHRYYKKHEGIAPRYTAGLWLGSAPVVQQAFGRRDAAPAVASLPLGLLRREGVTRAVVAREGQGRLYYRLAMDYFEGGGQQPARSRGLSVHRRYELLTPADDAKDALAHLPGQRVRVKAGTLVRVRLWLSVPRRGRFVALTDHLPAGLEPIDARLASAPQEVRRQERHEGFASGLAHRAIYDDRVSFYSDVLEPGVHEVSYPARAMTPGRFWARPAHAEEMYDPDTSGRSASTVVEVVAR